MLNLVAVLSTENIWMPKKRDDEKFDGGKLDDKRKFDNSNGRSDHYLIISTYEAWSK